MFSSASENIETFHSDLQLSWSVESSIIFGLLGVLSSVIISVQFACVSLCSDSTFEPQIN